MLIRGCYDVILGLTMPHWLWTCMNELLVPAQKGLIQWDLPAPELPNVHGALVVIISSLIVLKNITF